MFSPSACRTSTQRASGGLVRSNGLRNSAAITSSACSAGTSKTRSGAVTPATRLLHRHPVDGDERGPQDLVPAHDLIERRAQRRGVHLAAQRHRGLEVVGQVARRQLLEEPHPLLLQRQRYQPVPRSRARLAAGTASAAANPAPRRRRRPPPGPLVDEGGDRRHGRSPVHVGQAHRVASSSSGDLGRQPPDQQRITAQGKEVIVGADLHAPEQPRHDRRPPHARSASAARRPPRPGRRRPGRVRATRRGPPSRSASSAAPAARRSRPAPCSRAAVTRRTRSARPGAASAAT